MQPLLLVGLAAIWTRIMKYKYVFDTECSEGVTNVPRVFKYCRFVEVPI